MPFACAKLLSKNDCTLNILPANTPHRQERHVQYEDAYQETVRSISDDGSSSFRHLVRYFDIFLVKGLLENLEFCLHSPPILSSPV